MAMVILLRRQCSIAKLVILNVDIFLMFLGEKPNRRPMYWKEKGSIGYACYFLIECDDFNLIQ